MIDRAILWLREDYRLVDNPLWVRAEQACRHLLPVIIERAYSEMTPWGHERVGSHRRVYRAEVIENLRHQLEERGSVLWLAQGSRIDILLDWCREQNITHIFTECIAAEEEEEEVRALESAGMTVHQEWQSTMIDLRGNQRLLQRFPMSFTRFRQSCETSNLKADAPVERVLPKSTLEAWREDPRASFKLENVSHYVLDQRTSLPVEDGRWLVSEEAVECHITNNYFSPGHAHNYKQTRNQLMGVTYSSKWSTWLAHGVISARTLMDRLIQYEAQAGANESTYWLWFELLWRDYFRYLFYTREYSLFTYSGMSSDKAKAPTFDAATFARWSQGNTGEALVDAAMRELKSTGYLSNRLRQVVASFWLYECQGDWRAGAQWFEMQLLDYDVYSNYGNWLYIAGKGTDPRGGRHFNVKKQTDDYDPEGSYRSLWLSST